MTAVAAAILIQVPLAGDAEQVRDPFFVNASTEVHTAPAAVGKPIGKLLVAAPITIASHRGRWIRIEAVGWTQAGAERVIYAAPGLRIIRVVVARDAIDTLRFSDRFADPETGLLWTKTAVSGWVNTPDLKSSLDELWARAKPLFDERCTACHQRRVMAHYTANQWSSHLKVMGPRTGLPREDQFLIRAYLQHHSKDSAYLERFN